MLISSKSDPNLKVTTTL